MNHSKIILNPTDYNDGHLESLTDVLLHRIELQPINLIFLILFLLALIHTFLAHRFYVLATAKDNHLTNPHEENEKPHQKTFKSEILTFLSEVEVVFGLWCIPLFIIMTWIYGWKATLDYVNHETYQESLFIIPAMALASTYPIFHLTEQALSLLANEFSARFRLNLVVAWWLCIMTIGPLLGSFMKETVAMAISALLLSAYFFRFKPSKRLAYATLGLLFVNVSIGGTLTHFGNFSVSMVVKPWNWDTLTLITKFGWKALIAILINNFLYLYYFRKDFHEMLYLPPVERTKEPVPLWITCIHVLTLAWIIFNSDNTVIALGSFVLFLGFYEATREYQTPLLLRSAIMVGFFFASLVIFGGLQLWWLQPIITRLNDRIALGVTMTLSAFTHNTLINYLATQIPNLSDSLKEAIFAGTMLGGGLTIMANGPNLVGSSLLSKHFGHDISMKNLFFGAVFPTIIAALCYLLL